MFFDHPSDDKATWSMLLYGLFLEKCAGKSRRIAQASVSTHRTCLLLLASASSRPGHQLHVSSELVQCQLRYMWAAVALTSKGGGVLWLLILGFYVTSSLYKPLSVNKMGGVCLA